MNPIFRSFIAAAFVLLASPVMAYQVIDISGVANGRLQNELGGLGALAGGLRDLAGVPFDILGAGDNYWNAHNAAGANPRVLTIPLAIVSASEVHTLISSFWGTNGAPSRASIEFSGTGGALHTVSLFGNSDIRDYNQNVFTNTINGTTTVNVINNGAGQRLDKQAFLLPVSFIGETLNQIRLIDNGATGVQRVLLAGVTVQSVPLPAGLPLLAVACGFALRRRRRA